MQAHTNDILKLDIFSDVFLGVSTVSVLGFLKLLKSLTYTFHQLGYLTTAKH